MQDIHVDSCTPNHELISPPYMQAGPPLRPGPRAQDHQPDSTTGRRARQADVRSREGPFVSDTTDLMGVNAAPPEPGGSGGTPPGVAADNADAPATDASAAPASGAAPKRRRSGTGLEGMVLAELQQVASGLGIKGTARMRKSQLIETIKERQAGGGSAPIRRAPPVPRGKDGEAGRRRPADAKPKRRATSRARTGESGRARAQDGQQIDIPGQPANEEKRRPASAAAAATGPRQGGRRRGRRGGQGRRPQGGRPAGQGPRRRAAASGKGAPAATAGSSRTVPRSATASAAAARAATAVARARAAVAASRAEPGRRRSPGRRRLRAAAVVAAGAATAIVGGVVAGVRMRSRRSLRTMS